MKKVYLSILSATIVGLVACGVTKHEEVAVDSAAAMATEAVATVVDSAAAATATVVDSAAAHVEAAVDAHAAH
jgi:hypothetical protein